MLVARERAEKRVSTIDPATRKPMSEVDWRAKVEEQAVEIFASMSPVQVSAAFDAPQFCDEWISVARPTGLYEGYVVKCRGVARDKKGNPKISKTKGTELITWVIYDPRKAA
jgi:hypothetical protein